METSSTHIRHIRSQLLLPLPFALRLRDASCLCLPHSAMNAHGVGPSFNSCIAQMGRSSHGSHSRQAALQLSSKWKTVLSPLPPLIGGARRFMELARLSRKENAGKSTLANRSDGARPKNRAETARAGTQGSHRTGASGRSRSEHACARHMCSEASQNKGLQRGEDAAALFVEK